MTRQPSRPAVEDLVATYWPQPDYDRDGLSSALSTARTLVRWANHATLNASAETLPRANDLEGVTNTLYELAAGLPQLLQQISGRLGHLAAEDPTLYAYTGEASTVTTAAAQDFTSAVTLAAALSGALDSARQHLAGVGHRARPSDNEDDA